LARYRKIAVRIWNDTKFCGLSDDGKLVFFFLMTHPHMTSLGAMRATTQGMAAEVGWSHQRLLKAFREAFQKGLIQFNEDAHFIGLPRFLKYNSPESPNVVRSWEKAVDLIPECAEKTQLLHDAKGYAEDTGEAFGEAFAKAFGSLPEAFAKGMPNQEQEQEQEQEPEQEIAPDPLEGFDEFKKIYPRAVAWPDAERAWKKTAGVRPPLDELLAAVVAWRGSEQWRDPKFIPYPATWLNRHGWADEVPKSAAGQSPGPIQAQTRTLSDLETERTSAAQVIATCESLTEAERDDFAAEALAATTPDMAHQAALKARQADYFRGDA